VITVSNLYSADSLQDIVSCCAVRIALGAFDAKWATCPSVLFDGKLYRMWYSSYYESDVGRAESATPPVKTEFIGNAKTRACQCCEWELRAVLMMDR
jgi:hypothetical protein